MADLTVTITGIEENLEYFEVLPKRIGRALHQYATTASDGWLEQLKANIDHVVYDMYEPRVYQRNKNLVLAASKEVSQSQDASGMRTEVRLFNDSSKITYQPRADGSVGPRGGVSKEQVPWQIELGEYPNPWYGYSLPRPAYLMTADALRPIIIQEVEAVILATITE